MAISFSRKSLSDTKISWRSLYAKPNQLNLPFKLNLKDHQDPVLCQKALRVLPKKRITFLGEWRGKKIIIKLFLQPHRAHFHFERELKGIQTLIDSATPTASLLYQGSSARYNIPLIITEYLENSCDISTAIKNNPQDISLLKNLVLELAIQHVQGIVQEDLHFQNFRLQNNKIFSIDASHIFDLKEPLNKKLTIENLALFLAQFGAMKKDTRHYLLNIYIKARGLIFKKQDIASIDKLTSKYLHNRFDAISKKVLRTSSLAELHKNLWSNVLVAKNEPIDIFKKPELIFKNKNFTFLKQGNSATVIQTQIENKSYVIKKYNYKSFTHRIKKLGRKSRAKHAWQIAHTLDIAGIQTAKPVACIEKHVFNINYANYFVMEYIPGKNLYEYFEDYDPNITHFNRVAINVIELIKKLHFLKLCHRDLKATNIIIKNEQPFLIDLDGVKKSNRFKNDWKRFMKNWRKQPAVSALFQHYLKNVRDELFNIDAS